MVGQSNERDSAMYAPEDIIHVDEQLVIGS